MVGKLVMVFIEKLFSVNQNLFWGTILSYKTLNQVVHNLESSVDNVYVKKTFCKIEDF